MSTRIEHDGTVDILSRPADITPDAQLRILNSLLRARVRKLEGMNAELSVKVDEQARVIERLTEELNKTR